MDTIVNQLVSQITGGITTDVMTVILALLGIGLLMLGFRLIKRLVGMDSMDSNGFYISSNEWDDMTDAERQEYIEDMKP